MALYLLSTARKIVDKNKKQKMTTRIYQILLLILIPFSLAITGYCYWFGLGSAFLFDDIPNMNTIGRYTHLGGWRDLTLYLLEGSSGLLGRPLSLASFYLNDQIWEGMDKSDFKYTNLMIHLLNGLLIFWLLERLRPYLALTKPWGAWLPLIASLAWLLHPMHTNTVLYAVQRMTELSAVFTLVGLICYIHARELFAKQPARAWMWLIIGGGFSMALALLSKENGILVVVYVLVIEFTLIRPQGQPVPKQLSRALLLCAWLPTTLLLIMLYKWGWIDKTDRAFNTTERLMSEARILWIYISHIFIPSYHGSSLLYDDIEISRGLLSPLTTLPALLGIFALGGLAWYVRKSLPLLSFAIAWFFAGHLLESTTVALELYFEHRNYLPLLGFIVAGVYYALDAMQTSVKLRRVMPVVLVVYLSLLAISTQHIAKLWTDPAKLFITWLEQHPNSQRTLEGLDAVIGEHISPATRQQLLAELERVAAQETSTSYLVFRNLKIACQNNSLSAEQLPQALENLSHSSFIAPLPNVLAEFVYAWTESHCGKITTAQMLAFLDQFRSITALQKGEMPQILHYWQAEVHVQQGNLAEAMQHFDAAYALDKNIDLLLLQATYLMSAGLYAEADSKLSHAKQDFCGNWRTCLILKMRQPDLDNLRSALQDKLQQEKANHHAQQAVDYSASQK